MLEDNGRLQKELKSLQSSLELTQQGKDRIILQLKEELRKVQQDVVAAQQRMTFKS